MATYSNPVEATLHYSGTIDILLKQTNAAEETKEFFENKNYSHVLPCDHPVIVELKSFFEKQHDIQLIPGATTFRKLPELFQMTPYLAMYLSDPKVALKWFELIDAIRDVVIEHNSTFLLSLDCKNTVVPPFTQQDSALILDAIAEIGVKIPTSMDVGNVESIDDLLVQLSQSPDRQFYSLLEKVVTQYSMYRAWLAQVHDFREYKEASVSKDSELWDAIQNHIGRLSVQSIMTGELMEAGADRACVNATIEAYSDQFRSHLKAVSQLDINENKIVTDYFDILYKEGEELAAEAVVLNGQLEAQRNDKIMSSYDLMPSNMLNQSGQIQMLLEEVKDLRELLRKVSVTAGQAMTKASFTTMVYGTSQDNLPS